MFATLATGAFEGGAVGLSDDAHIESDDERISPEGPDWLYSYFDERKVEPRDDTHRKKFPLLSYAALHWPEHAKDLVHSTDIFDLSLPFWKENSQTRKNLVEILSSYRNSILRFRKGIYTITNRFMSRYPTSCCSSFTDGQNKKLVQRGQEV